MTNKNSAGWEFLRFCRQMAVEAKEEAIRQKSAKKLFDDECVRINRSFIRIVRDNGRSRIDWKHYEGDIS